MEKTQTPEVNTETKTPPPVNVPPPVVNQGSQIAPEPVVPNVTQPAAEGNGTTPEETPAQKKDREKKEKADLKAKEKADKAAKALKAKEARAAKKAKAEEDKGQVQAFPTKPAASGKKPADVFDLEAASLIVRPVKEKGKDGLIGYACMPLNFGNWKIGVDGKEQEVGTYLIVDKDQGKRAAMPGKTFDKGFEWVSDQMLNCKAGKVPA